MERASRGDKSSRKIYSRRASLVRYSYFLGGCSNLYGVTTASLCVKPQAPSSPTPSPSPPCWRFGVDNLEKEKHFISFPFFFFLWKGGRRGRRQGNRKDGGGGGERRYPAPNEAVECPSFVVSSSSMELLSGLDCSFVVLILKPSRLRFQCRE